MPNSKRAPNEGDLLSESNNLAARHNADRLRLQWMSGRRPFGDQPQRLCAALDHTVCSTDCSAVCAIDCSACHRLQCAAHSVRRSALCALRDKIKVYKRGCA